MSQQSAVIRELKRIAKENGGLLHPDAVVAEARPKSSPLHSRFEWDDTVAGHQYRIWQARKLIKVSVEVIGGSQETHNVFVSLTPDRERESGGYRILTEVLTDSQMREQMLSDALAELELFKQKYARLVELASVFNEIKKVRRK